MATNQELTERVEALEKAMAEVHARFVAPQPKAAKAKADAE